MNLGKQLRSEARKHMNNLKKHIRRKIYDNYN